MKISILGTGAIGGFYGIMLANSGHEVNFLLRGDHEHVVANGLTLQSEIHGKVSLTKVNAFNDPKEMPRADVVLVCLKTTQNSNALIDILPQLANEHTLVVLVQNGLGMEEELATTFPNFQIAGGVALITSYKAGNGMVVHQDHGNLDMGSYNVKNMELFQEFSESLKSAGVVSSINDLDYLRWKKLVWNMAFNGVSVVLDMTTTEILADKVGSELVVAIMREVILAARACNVVLPEHFDESMLEFTSKMRPYKPSMKLDYDFSRPMETEYLYGRPIWTAAKAGVDMVFSRELYGKLLELDGNH